MNKLMWPEFVDGVFDEFDERDEQSPGVWSVDDESLEEHPGDLLLHGLGVGFSEQVQEAAREVVRVAVRVAQLVRDRVQEQIPVNTSVRCSEGKSVHDLAYYEQACRGSVRRSKLYEYSYLHEAGTYLLCFMFSEINQFNLVIFSASLNIYATKAACPLWLHICTKSAAASSPVAHHSRPISATKPYYRGYISLPS